MVCIIEAAFSCGMKERISSMNEHGMIFDIARNSYVDGPGIRTTVFFKGCNLRCLWCHNPESQHSGTEMLYYRNKCTGCGKCVEKCAHNAVETPENCVFCGNCAHYCPHDARRIVGKLQSVSEIMDIVRRDRAFYGDDGGMTCSGGECMLQIDFLAALLHACRLEGIHTAVDTAGCVPFDRFERILPDTDLFLYDVKTVDPARHREMTGVDPALILENLDKLLSRGARVWIRVPVIGGVNDTVEEMRAIRDLAGGRAALIDLLPYHRLGDSKYEALGREYRVFAAPSEERMKELRALFED